LLVSMSVSISSSHDFLLLELWYVNLRYLDEEGDFLLLIISFKLSQVWSSKSSSFWLRPILSTSVRGKGASSSLTSTELSLTSSSVIAVLFLECVETFKRMSSMYRYIWSYVNGSFVDGLCPRRWILRTMITDS
jgi:hypothetical protein